MPYPNSTRNPEEHFDLVLDDVRERADKFSNKLESEGLDMTYTILDDYPEEVRYRYGVTTTYRKAFIIIELSVNGLDDLINETTLSFWRGFVDGGYKFASFETDIDEIYNFILSTEEEEIKIGYEEPLEEDNDFRIFLEVTQPDSKIHKIISNLEPTYSVDVEDDVDFHTFVTATPKFRSSVRSILTEVEKLFDEGKLGDLETLYDFSYSYGESIITHYIIEDEIEPNYILDEFKYWEENHNN